MASPGVNFLSIKKRKISGGYHDLPIGTKIVVVNTVNNKTVDGVGATIKVLGGRLLIEVPASVPAGDYVLRALDAGGGYLAQSVNFPID